MKNNNNLNAAKRVKNDEFYTQLMDIEKECHHYRPHFKDAVVLCNCNDALHSNFAVFFSLNFEFLGLKKLICTEYGEHAKARIYTGDKNGNNIPDLEEWETIELDGDGSFNSPECLEFLEECDIVVTNPPFSLFREFIATMMKFNKKFLVIGNGNAVTYKEIFPLIKENKLWLGYKGFSGGMDMIAGDNYDASKCKHPKYDAKGNTLINVMMCVWFTNLEHSKRHEPLDLYKKYTPEEYPKYDNYDAIEVSKVVDIPIDYEGVMGVPISFLDKYCPEQFEIVGIANSARYIGDFPCLTIVNGKKIYNRILIRKRK